MILRCVDQYPKGFAQRYPNEVKQFANVQLVIVVGNLCKGCRMCKKASCEESCLLIEIQVCNPIPGAFVSIASKRSPCIFPTAVVCCASRRLCRDSCGTNLVLRSCQGIRCVVLVPVAPSNLQLSGFKNTTSAKRCCGWCIQSNAMR